MKKKLLIIGGPTASGKTELSVEIAKRIGGEIISCDSMQVYKGLDIGTSKIKGSEMKGVKHHMLDIVDPTVNYSVSDYVEKAIEIIEDLFNRDIQPIIVGGTGFYISALVYKKSLGLIGCNENIRKKYTELAEKEGNIALYDRLLSVDRETAEKLSPNDVKRIIRALEIYEVTGKTKSSQNDVEKRYDFNIYCKEVDRGKLYNKIDKRVDEMVSEGLFDEVKKIKSIDRNSTALSAIGYKEIVDYFDGKLTKDEAISKVKLNTRHYAKRQLTYFRHQFNCKYIPSELQTIEQVNYVIDDFYS